MVRFCAHAEGQLYYSKSIVFTKTQFSEESGGSIEWVIGLPKSGVDHDASFKFCG